MKSFLLKICDNKLTTRNIRWRYTQETQFFYDGLILHDEFTDLDNLDGTYSLIYIKSHTLYVCTDFWGTKPLFYQINSDNIIVTSDPFKYDIKTYKLVPRNTKLIIRLDTSEVTFCAKSDLMIKFDATVNTLTEYIYEIVNNLRNRKLGVLLSEGYDSGVIASILLRMRRDFYAASIDLGTHTHILRERHSLIRNGRIISPKLIDDVETYTTYCSKVDRLILNDSCQPDLTSVWGFRGSCMLLKALKDNNTTTCLHGAGADAMFLPNVTNFIKYNKPKDLPYPYNEALDIQNTCVKGEFVAKMFNVDVVPIFLTKRMWEIMLGVIQSNNLGYKQVFAEILTDNNFPFAAQTTISTKVGLERSWLSELL